MNKWGRKTLGIVAVTVLLLGSRASAHGRSGASVAGRTKAVMRDLSNAARGAKIPAVKKGIAQAQAMVRNQQYTGAATKVKAVLKQARALHDRETVRSELADAQAELKELLYRVPVAESDGR